jgi:hypothetical protein
MDRRHTERLGGADVGLRVVENRISSMRGAALVTPT